MYRVKLSLPKFCGLKLYEDICKTYGFETNDDEIKTLGKLNRKIDYEISGYIDNPGQMYTIKRIGLFKHEIVRPDKIKVTGNVYMIKEDDNTNTLVYFKTDKFVNISTLANSILDKYNGFNLGYKIDDIIESIDVEG